VTLQQCVNVKMFKQLKPLLINKKTKRKCV